MKSIEDWDTEVEEDSEVLESNIGEKDRYRIVVEFIVKSESIDDAEASLKDLIDYGVLSMIDHEDQEIIHSYEIIDADPAECD